MISKVDIDALYRQYNRRKYVRPDPLQFLYDYPEVRDREIVGLIASSLAYGRVAQILKSVKRVLDIMGTAPRDFLDDHTLKTLLRLFNGFKHRFTTHDEIADLLTGIKRVVQEYGSLNECFVAGFDGGDKNVVGALEQFVDELNCSGNYLIPSPRRGSACKRLNLYLRWMVRKDAVDPGGWMGVPKDKLIVPLDTHMAKIGKKLKLTSRTSADMKMAIEITESFKKMAPKDPVKYDFALTRFGIRSDMSIQYFDNKFDT